jgi:hypothetical protein
MASRSATWAAQCLLTLLAHTADPKRYGFDNIECCVKLGQPCANQTALYVYSYDVVGKSQFASAASLRR